LEAVGEHTCIDLIADYEEGKRRMKRRDLIKIARALDLRLTHF